MGRDIFIGSGKLVPVVSGMDGVTPALTSVKQITSSGGSGSGGSGSGGSGSGGSGSGSGSGGSGLNPSTGWPPPGGTPRNNKDLPMATIPEYGREDEFFGGKYEPEKDGTEGTIDIPPVPENPDDRPKLVQYAEEYLGKYWYLVIIVMVFLWYRKK